MKRPPYSRLLAERADRPYSWWVLIGDDAWDKAAIWSEVQHRIFTLCPPGEDPAALDWSAYCVAPPPVGLVRCGDINGNQLQALVLMLLSAGSPRVYDLLVDSMYNAVEVAA